MQIFFNKYLAICIPRFLHLWVQPTAGQILHPQLVESVDAKPTDVEAECAGPVYEKDLSICGWWHLGVGRGVLGTISCPLPQILREDCSFHLQLILLVRVYNILTKSLFSF